MSKKSRLEGKVSPRNKELQNIINEQVVMCNNTSYAKTIAQPNTHRIEWLRRAMRFKITGVIEIAGTGNRYRCGKKNLECTKQCRCNRSQELATNSH